MTTFWTPRRTEQRASVPLTDVELSNGLVLRHVGKWQHAEVYENEALKLRVLASMDDTRHGLLLHVSLSHPDHLPDWEYVKRIKYAFYGDDRDAMMVLPRKEDYVNKHPYCLHLWETPSEWGIQ